MAENAIFGSNFEISVYWGYFQGMIWVAIYGEFADTLFDIQEIVLWANVPGSSTTGQIIVRL
jgi:hypothetical protein